MSLEDRFWNKVNKETESGKKYGVSRARIGQIIKNGGR